MNQWPFIIAAWATVLVAIVVYSLYVVYRCRTRGHPGNTPKDAPEELE